MDDARRYGLNPQFDIHQILLEAKTRWLRPSEICEILRNYVRFNITPDPPYKPPGGSLYLFDRKALRYFRKDGHHWRKKKDGKTVREAHEKLKSGSVDVLHCYYAHGEDNENFQRRSYWLLDGKLEHIVLVHYRDLKEGSHQLYSDPNLARVPTSLEICSTFASSNSSTEWKTQTSSEFEVGNSWDDFCGASQANKLSSSGFQVSSFLESGMAEEKVLVRTSSISHPYGGFLMNTEGFNKSVEPLSDQIISHNFMLGRGQNVHRVSDATVSFGDCQFSHHSTPSVWSEVHRFNQNHNEIKDRSIFFDHLSSTVVLKNKTADPIPDNYKKIKFEVDGDYQVQPDFHAQLCDGAVSAPVQIKEETITCDVRPFDDDHTLNSAVHGFKISNQKNSYGGHSDIIKPPDCKTKVSDALNSTLQRYAHDGVLGEFKKLDSFGRWMRKDLVKDSDQTLIASNRNYWTTTAISSDEKEISSLSPDMQLEIDSLAPSVSQEQLFSIIDFSPDWTYSGGGTKVLISGTFLAGVPKGIHFCCMFGEVEVSSELLGSNTICCYAPPHVPGRVPFYLTSSNRLACSEIREFEYRENPSSSKLSSSQNVFEDELHLEIHFAKFLSLVSGNMLCSAENCYICSMKNKLYHMLIDETEWYNIENLRVYHEHHRNHRDVLLVNLLKGRLYEWLLYKAHEEGKGLNTLDEQGRGIIHLAAALGYEWAMKPIVAAGISPSFRDSHGRTALHWAAYYGREETVSTLLKVGAFPGAVEDPTSKFPQGQTAADLASSRGHKGIAGYLAEADLTSHLFSMSSIDKALDSVSVAHAAEHIVETLEEKVQELASVEEGQISLRETLAAMRNSAQAAARIQAAFRIQSFRQRDNTYRAQKYELTEALMISSLNNNIQRANHFHSSSHIAAIKIQQQYRGWKARREFLKIRARIVKIQAHVRGHQARKQYKKIIWSVSIVEKVILRWRRKGSGLRGFRNEGITFGHDQDEEKIDEYEFLRLGRKQKVVGIEKALSRVKSMVRCPAARDQYMRLISSSNKSNLQLGVEKSSLDRS